MVLLADRGGDAILDVEAIQLASGAVGQRALGFV